MVSGKGEVVVREGEMVSGNGEMVSGKGAGGGNECHLIAGGR